MINALLHKQPVAADRNEHASLRMRVPTPGRRSSSSETAAANSRLATW